VSKKTVPFSMPASASRSRSKEPVALDEPSRRRAAPSDFAGARPDDWVRNRDLAAGPAPLDDALAPTRVFLDVAAERSLMEVFALTFLVPFALGWFWWVNALTGRARF
jgi:hypothetical protein